MSHIRIPQRWVNLLAEPGPKMLKEALRLYATLETPGHADNPEIIRWAHEINQGGTTWISDMFERGGDAVPWCGLFMGVVAKRAGKPLPRNPLSALAWSDWGNPVKTPMLGDVLTFTRTGGGHVGLYVGESNSSYYVLGGNQNDEVNISPIRKSQFYAARNFYAIGQPANCRVIPVIGGEPALENMA